MKKQTYVTLYLGNSSTYLSILWQPRWHTITGLFFSVLQRSFNVNFLINDPRKFSHFEQKLQKRIKRITENCYSQLWKSPKIFSRSSSTTYEFAIIKVWKNLFFLCFFIFFCFFIICLGCSCVTYSSHVIEFTKQRCSQLSKLALLCIVIIFSDASIKQLRRFEWTQCWKSNQWNVYLLLLFWCLNKIRRQPIYSL